MVISNAGVGTCDDTLTNNPDANFPGISLLEYKCQFADASANDFDIQMVQTMDTGPILPYTVDFKVDGVTIPELSGEMQPVDAPLFTATDLTRNFRFTNNNMRNTVVIKELDPAPSGDFLRIAVSSDATDDQFTFAIIRQPGNIGGTDSCTAPATGAAGLSLDCDFFAVGDFSMAAYEFTLDVAAGGTAGFDEYTITTTFNGVQVAQQTVEASATAPPTQTFKFRVDSPSGPLIVLP